MVILKIVGFIAYLALCGWLWHLGGQGKPWARGFVFPAVITLIRVCFTHNICEVLYAPCLWVALKCFTYGENAPVHKFWLWVCGGPSERVEVLTRATCGFGWSLAGIVFAVSGDWIKALIYTIVCTILCTYFGRRENVTVSECGSGASVALSILI